MLHVGLEPSAEAWLSWAGRNGVHALVMAFVRARPDRLYEAPPSDASPAYPTPRAWHMLSDALASVSNELWSALAAGSVGDRAGAEFSAFAKRALLAPSLEQLAAGLAAAPTDPDLIYFLGASCLARLGQDDAEQGLIAAKALNALAEVSMEVAVWTLDLALRREQKNEAAEAFEQHVRSAGSRMLVDVLRLGRFSREADAG